MKMGNDARIQENQHSNSCTLAFKITFIFENLSLDSENLALENACICMKNLVQEIFPFKSEHQSSHLVSCSIYVKSKLGILSSYLYLFFFLFYIKAFKVWFTLITYSQLPKHSFCNRYNYIFPNLSFKKKVPTWATSKISNLSSKRKVVHSVNTFFIKSHQQ